MFETFKQLFSGSLSSNEKLKKKKSGLVYR